MFFHRIGITFILKGLQGLDYLEPGGRGLNDIIDVSPLRGNVGVGDGIVIFFFLFGEELGGIFSLAGLSAVEDLSCSL